MIRILKSLTPSEFQKSEKLFNYYLKTLSDRIYKRSVPEVSKYELQILKDIQGFTIVNHGHYTTTVTKYTFRQVAEIIELHFKGQNIKEPEMCEQKQFIMDLRF